MSKLCLIILSLFSIRAFSSQIVTIEEDTYIFTDDEAFGEFEDEYGDNECLTANPKDTCKCNIEVGTAKLEALESGYHISPANEIGKKIKRQKKTLDQLSLAARRQTNRILNGEKCLPFGEYKNTSCASNSRTFKYKSCACYEKWTKDNLVYLSKKIKANLKKIKQQSADEEFIDSLITTSMNIAEQCAPSIKNPIALNTCSENTSIRSKRSSQRRRNTPKMIIERSEYDRTIRETAELIKNKSLNELLCNGNDEDIYKNKQSLFDFMSKDYDNRLYEGSHIKKEVERLGDERYCLLPFSHMRIASSKIKNFKSKYSSIASYQFSCRFSGLTLGTFCHSNQVTKSSYEEKIRLNCSSSATGYVQLPPYGVGTPSPYQKGGISGIEIKETDACEFLMEKCHELSTRVNYSDKKKTHRSMIDNFLKPLENLQFNGKRAAVACHGSEPTATTVLRQQVESALLDVDVKGGITSMSTKAIGIAVMANPILKQIYENGGETVIELVISSLIELRYRLTSINISPIDRNGRKRSQEELKKLYQKEKIYQIKKAIKNISSDVIQTACTSVEGPQRYVQFLKDSGTFDELKESNCTAIIEASGIEDVIGNMIDSF